MHATTPLIPKPVKRPATLKATAQALNRTHARVGAHQAAALEHAIECGALLHYAKSLVKHGEWESWVAENFGGSFQTARDYQRIAIVKAHNCVVLDGVTTVGEARRIARTVEIPADLPPELPGLMMPPKPVPAPDGRPSILERETAEQAEWEAHEATDRARRERLIDEVRAEIQAESLTPQGNAARRVEGLLAQAASVAGAERETFALKAVELIAKHALYVRVSVRATV